MHCSNSKQERLKECWLIARRFPSHGNQSNGCLCGQRTRNPFASVPASTIASSRYFLDQQAQPSFTTTTYSDLEIARRITEDYNIEHLTLHCPFRQANSSRTSWLRRHNDPAATEMQKASTTDAIEQLLAEGRIRQYGHRQLITHLARKHGHRSRRNDVLTALQILDDYGVASRTPGMKEKKGRDNYVVPRTWW